MKDMCGIEMKSNAALVEPFQGSRSTWRPTQGCAALTLGCWIKPLRGTRQDRETIENMKIRHNERPQNKSLQTDRRSRYQGCRPLKATDFGDHRALWWRRPLSSNVVRRVSSSLHKRFGRLMREQRKRILSPGEYFLATHMGAVKA